MPSVRYREHCFVSNDYERLWMFWQLFSFGRILWSSEMTGEGQCHLFTRFYSSCSYCFHVRFVCTRRRENKRLQNTYARTCQTKYEIIIIIIQTRTDVKSERRDVRFWFRFRLEDVKRKKNIRFDYGHCAVFSDRLILSRKRYTVLVCRKTIYDGTEFTRRTIRDNSARKTELCTAKSDIQLVIEEITRKDNSINGQQTGPARVVRRTITKNRKKSNNYAFKRMCTSVRY